VSFVPIPSGSVTNIPALFTMELPDTIRYDETFRVLIQQSAGTRVGSSARRGRHPGQKGERSPPRGGAQLALLRYVARTIPSTDRWAPIFTAYISSRVAARVRGFGGDQI